MKHLFSKNYFRGPGFRNPGFQVGHFLGNRVWGIGFQGLRFWILGLGSRVFVLDYVNIFETLIIINNFGTKFKPQ